MDVGTRISKSGKKLYRQGLLRDSGISCVSNELTGASFSPRDLRFFVIKNDTNRQLAFRVGWCRVGIFEYPRKKMKSSFPVALSHSCCDHQRRPRGPCTQVSGYRQDDEIRLNVNFLAEIARLPGLLSRGRRKKRLATKRAEIVPKFPQASC